MDNSVHPADLVHLTGECSGLGCAAEVADDGCCGVRGEVAERRRPLVSAGWRITSWPSLMRTPAAARPSPSVEPVMKIRARDNSSAAGVLAPISGAGQMALRPGLSQPGRALQQAQGQLQNNIRSTLLQGLAGVLLVAGAVTTWRQVQISREGHITDRLTHAIDQVGNDKVDIRIGGIYALERLAKDSVADRISISEILAAFIRTHAPWPAGHWSHPDPHPTPSVDETMLWLTGRAPDVRTAILALGRYPTDYRDYRLALRRVDLRRTNFYHGTLINVDLGDSNLAGCYAAGVHWEMCRFRNTDLRKTRLMLAKLDESDFTGAHLQAADLEGATLRNANLSNASLRGANLR